MLEDGSYEALVVDVEGGVLSLTILTGAHKGAVVEVRDGEPKVIFD